MYEVVLRKKAEKDLRSIAKKHELRIVAALLGLRKEPKEGKALKGKLEGLYSFKVYPYRIIYKIDKKRRIVFIIRIGHRQGAYK